MDHISAPRNKDHHMQRSEILKNVFKTIFLVLGWVCLGLTMEVSGPALIDLKARTKSSYEEVATAIAGQNAGYFIGAVLGGLFVDKLGLYCELMVALALDGLAVAAVGIPWVPRTEVIWVLCCIQGTCGGIMNTSGMKLIFNMWQEKAASPMHLLHGGYGIGSFIIPLIANPFLAVPKTKDHNDTIYNATLDLNGVNRSYAVFETNSIAQEDTAYLKPSRIEYAYLIPAVITICLSLVFHAYHFLGLKERKIQREKDQRNVVSLSSLKFKEMLNPATCAGGDVLYGLQIFVLLFLFYFNCEGGERVGGTFIRAYSIDHFEFSVDSGSYINTTYWISFAVGRFVGFILARWIPIRILILLESGGVLVSSICLAILGGSSPTALWILVQPMGFFTGPFFPSGYAWGNYHVHMTGSGIAVLQLGASVGALVYMKMMGFLYDTYGTKTYLYVLLGYAIAMCIISVLLDVLGAQHRKMKSTQNDEHVYEVTTIKNKSESKRF